MKIKYTILFLLFTLGIILVAYVFLEEWQKGSNAFFLALLTLLIIFFCAAVLWVYSRSGKDMSK